MGRGYPSLPPFTFTSFLPSPSNDSLILVSLCSNLDCLELMIGQGCHVNARDKYGRTPLHYAAATAQFQCILSLIGNGAEVNITDLEGRTPLHYASSADADAK